MKRIPLTRNAAFSPFPSYLHRAGADVARIMRALSLNLETLKEQENLLPFGYACRFVEAVEGVDGMEQLGLKVGANTSITELGDFGVNLANAHDLADLLDRVVKTVPMTNSGATAWLDEGVNDDSVSLNLKHDACPARASLDGFALLVLIDAVRLVMGKSWIPSHVSIDQAAGNLSAYKALSGAEMNRDVGYMSFDIPKAFLNEPLGLVSTQDDLAIQCQLSDSAPSSDLIGSIEQTVRAGLGNYLPSIDETAELAGVSIRTLQNNLKDRNLVYRQVTSNVRFEEAKRLLEDGKMYINEIASHLGYNDTSNFNHAFKKWSGVSPKNFRESLKNDSK
jgi:AraC-like DNA-binding protein